MCVGPTLHPTPFAGFLQKDVYNGHMKKANVAELKNRLSHYLSKVKRGETVLVMERSLPIARIVPAVPPSQMSSGETDTWLKRLKVDGILWLGTRKGVPGVIRGKPSGKRPTGAVKTLLEDREQR
jgi:prevent-host-death family protein